MSVLCSQESQWFPFFKEKEVSMTATQPSHQDNQEIICNWELRAFFKMECMWNAANGSAWMTGSPDSSEMPLCVKLLKVWKVIIYIVLPKLMQFIKINIFQYFFPFYCWPTFTKMSTLIQNMKWGVGFVLSYALGDSLYSKCGNIHSIERNWLFRFPDHWKISFR